MHTFTRALSWTLLVVSLAGCAPIKTQVESVTPAAGAIIQVDDLSTVTIIEVLFDHRMDLATITDESFIVTGSISGVISGLISGVGENRTVIYRPLVPLLIAETIDVRLTDAIRSQSGKGLEPYAWSFLIEGGIVVPPGTGFAVQSMTPAIESVTASPSSLLQPRFTSPYNPFSAGSATVLVDGSRSGAHQVTLQDVLTGIDTLKVATDRDFLAGERVTISLLDGLYGIDNTQLDPTILGLTILNLGSQWPGTQLDSGTGLAAGRVVFLDPDADGIDEWAIVHGDGTVVLQDATPSGLGNSTSWTISEALAGAVAGDFDGDGRIDLACLGATGERIHLLRGSFSIAISLEAPIEILLSTVSTQLSAAHVDEDGIIDIIATGPNGLAVAWGSSADPLSQQVHLDSGAVVGPPAAADLSGDDLIDLAAAQTDGSILILSGTGDGAFTSAGTISGYSAAVGVLAGNLDGDGLRDLLVIPGGTDTPSTLLSDGDMNFSLRVLFNGVAHPGAQLVDWDGDGKIDCLAPVPGTTTLNFSAGADDGNFSQPVALSHTVPVRAFALGDADGDGALDIALESTAGDWQISRAEPINLPPADRIRVEDLIVSPGDQNITFPLLVDCETDLQGWTVVLIWDPAVIKLDSLDSTGTTTESLIEFELSNIDNTYGVSILAAILDMVPPFDNQTLVAGNDHEIARAVADIENTAAPGSHLYGPADGYSANASPLTNNSFVSAGVSVFPELLTGIITVDAAPATGGNPPVEETTFLRGDVNLDGSVNLTDGSQLQLWLTNGGDSPACLDAADVNDDGVVNLSDPIYLFDFLYQGSTPPPAPYPTIGPDPTADGLDCNQ
ncbi:MAG: FG-GAP-like repeat-containing protein [Planctomycetota bacterium]|nr:FG-GAP-like repeat-containing protein [Planctomycetota bacterium]